MLAGVEVYILGLHGAYVGLHSTSATIDIKDSRRIPGSSFILALQSPYIRSMSMGSSEILTVAHVASERMVRKGNMLRPHNSKLMTCTSCKRSSQKGPVFGSPFALRS